LIEAMQHTDAERTFKKRYADRIEELLKELGQLQPA